MKKPLIIFKNFSFRYYSQKKNTLTDLNITIYEGEKILIVGKNGSGKSTFLKCINGLIPHSYHGKITGSATIKEKKIPQTSIFDLSLEVGTIMQDTDNQFVGLTVAEDIAFALENDALASLKIHQQVNQWAQKLNLTSFLHHKPQDLSEGKKQLVTMAGVLIYSPSILLFDESLSNVDPKMRSQIISLIDQLHQENKNTILMVEHYLDDILDDSFDRVIVFEDGKIIADMTGEQIIKNKILLQQGIKEPSYIQVLRFAKIDLTKINYLLNLKKITIDNFFKEFIVFMNSSLKIKPKSTPLLFLNDNQKLLELKNITYRNPNKNQNILDNLSLTLFAGEMISIIGPNGCGKSTLGKIITGLLIPQKGKIKWGDFLSETKNIKVGFVTQNPYHMLSQKTVFEEVALGLRLQKLSQKEINQQVTSILNICDLSPFASWPINAISFGQKKRLTIAAILVLQPQIIVLDEPTAGQDFYHYTKVMLFLKKLNKKGTTIIIITNDMPLILEYTQTTLILSKGKIIAQNDPISILTDDLLIQKAGLKTISMIDLINKFKIKPQNKASFIKYIIDHNKELYLK
ncbi:ECF-type riboflavin transport system, ATP-binding protein [Candidatus Phytoplasma solani]|uniref:ABC transporter ATP-binding protein n=1 Tax=Candidatus Phytoplasma solani TaxID=69896 RepID=UPI0032DAD099